MGKLLKLTVATTLFLLCVPLFAMEVGIGLRSYGKTDLGPSIDLAHKLNDSFNVRLAIATTSTTNTKEESGDGLTWNDIMKFFALPLGGDVDVSQVSLLGDYHPWQGNFRLTGGISLMNFEWYKDKTDRTQYYFDNQSFSGTQVASTRKHFLTVENGFAPYLGLGWSTGFYKEKGWSFNGDFGISYIVGSHPSGGFEARCASQASEADCAMVQASAQSEHDRLKDPDQDGGLMGMANFGVSYKF